MISLIMFIPLAICIASLLYCFNTSTKQAELIEKQRKLINDQSDLIKEQQNIIDTYMRR